ncbi:MAG TPA: response regulator transcription factor [Burkholderiaceae bacterium]|nr:response regulator transcription factor [Burkholderiaceae bacterium]
MTTCLVVDDDPELRALVVEHLARFGIHSRTASDARAMRREVEIGSLDLVLLDLMLPDGNGIDLCKELRARSSLPVIMLTAQGDPISRVLGLELGADDYIAKPFEPRELIARIQAVLRRAGRGNGPALEPTGELPLPHFSGWTLDWRERTLVGADGIAMPLSNAEFRLLCAFLDHPGSVLSRPRLVELTRAGHVDASERSVDLAVSRLRQKLGDPPDDPRFIRTVRGQGYRFVAGPGDA